MATEQLKYFHFQSNFSTGLRVLFDRKNATVKVYAGEIHSYYSFMTFQNDIKLILRVPIELF